MKLKRGDTVVWRGAWGSEAPLLAKVTAIEENVRPGARDGDDMPEVAWAYIRGRNVIVNLDNGHWAYGNQLEPLPEARS